jgi:hypothetical protein
VKPVFPDARFVYEENLAVNQANTDLWKLADDGQRRAQALAC